MTGLLSRLILGSSRTLLVNEERVCRAAFGGPTWRHDFLLRQLAGLLRVRVHYTSPLVYSLVPELAANLPLDNEAECASPAVVVHCGAQGDVVVSVSIGRGGTISRIEIDASRVGWIRWFILPVVPEHKTSECSLDWCGPVMSAEQRADRMGQLLGWLGLEQIDRLHPRLCEPALRLREPVASDSTGLVGDIPLSGDLKTFYAITNGLLFPAGGDFPSLLPVEDLWQVDDEWGGLKRNRTAALRVIGGGYDEGFVLVDLSATQCVWLMKPEDGQWIRLGPFREFVRWLILQLMEHSGTAFLDLVESGRFERFSDFQEH